MGTLIHRRDFIRISSGVLLAHGLSRQDKVLGSRTPGLDERYLELGLTGMARADTWFPAHWGAAVIAGYFLCKDIPLHEDTSLAIKDQLDVLVGGNADAFKLFPSQSVTRERIEEIPEALRPALAGGLRASGHAAIYASLATRALKAAPQFAKPEILNGVIRHIQEIGRRSPQKAPAGTSDYKNSQAFIQSTFSRIAEFEALRGLPGIKRPNFTHWLTHTEALWNLEQMGYEDLARAGHAGHRAHLDWAVPSVNPKAERKTLEVQLSTLMHANYWQSTSNQAVWKKPFDRSESPNGDWIASGHLFKILYAFTRLAPRIEDEALVQQCERIAFERYVNPKVRGG